ncbi:MAG TPA: phenylacetate-CoA oxygenase subunit PaaI [Nocardioides bacterium]|uniref:1,2-phenylacetyl-CoA epoxidase subunit PaaC n=1 Tax=uncultured Nocardioides sp. TaxID=198441 RepID=UPI000EEC608E|nr:1,2-phenylacetyl-CoA epoxidase subunit PaaC [uncultured Nocardioides sp.]HCB04465.1 phenylacetate-CoA oxygenase subunit PaaI [Nocardioides sp.]HRD61055.1 phenylacetate-CoA oxygenase subunit PaaC [Nocardioides sp.]
MNDDEHSTPDPNDQHGSVYDGLLGTDTSQWAFGTDFEDPLAGVDTTVPDDLDAGELATYCLALGDDALVMSHRLSEWCSNAPDLEEDIALANIALDLLGQARLLLARAAAADPALVPALPQGSPVPVEDALAFFREAIDFHNVRLVELPNGDFAHTVARLLLFSTVRLAAFEKLATHRDPVLAAIAAKGVKELAYHRDYAGRWFLTLAQGTEESRRRLLAGLTDVWPLHDELIRAYDAGPDVDVILDQVFAVSAVERPEVGSMTGRGHTEALSRLLAEMQVVARAHPEGLW